MARIGVAIATTVALLSGLLAAPAEAAGASISGTVTGGATVPLPLEDVCVAAIELSRGSLMSGVEGRTDALGRYSITGLPPGMYLVAFNLCDAHKDGYAVEWWRDAPGLGNATVVFLADGGAETGIDASLDPAGSLDGTVTDDPGGHGLAGICVTALETTLFSISFDTTDAAGRYHFGNARPGNYLLVFNDCRDVPLYVPEVYDDRQASSTGGAPKTVAVQTGQPARADAALRLGGAVSGTLTAAHTGRPIPLMCVATWAEGATDAPGAVGVTGASPRGFDRARAGSFTVGGVPAGTYKVELNAALCGKASYATVWHAGAGTRGGGQPVSIAPGTHVTGLDVVLAPVPSIATTCPEGGVPEDGFRDISGSNVHRGAIACLAHHDVVRGRTASTYEPGRLVQRDQMAAFVTRALRYLGVTLDDEPPDAFDDDNGNTHELAINQLAALGVIRGRGARRYGPGAAVTRAEMATFLVAAYEEATGLTLRTDGDRFQDDDGSTHEHAVNRAAVAGLTAGKSATRFDPGAGVRRDQLASFVARLLTRAMVDITDRFISEGVVPPTGATQPSPLALPASFTGASVAAWSGMTSRPERVGVSE